MKQMKNALPGFFDDDQFDKENLVSYGKQATNIFHLWLIDDVGDAKLYMKWFDILQNANENDMVVIHINSYGGDLMTTNQIVTQIKTCAAKVVCQIESACCSAATMIALACDGMICMPHGYMMIHTSSGCTFGKQSDIRRQEDFYNKWLERFFQEIYQHFLSEKEIVEVLNGKDMWLDCEEVLTRFKRKVDAFNREQAKQKKMIASQVASTMMGESGRVEANASEAESSDAGKPKAKRKTTKKQQQKKTKKQ